MFVQCHVEETDQFGNSITTSNNPSTPACSKRNVAKEFKMDDEEDEGYEMGGDEEEEDEEKDTEQEENKPKATRAVPSNIPPHPFPTSAQNVAEYLNVDISNGKGYGQVFKMKQIFKKKLKKKKSFGRKSRSYGFIKYSSISFSKTHEKKRKTLSKCINTH